jgi:AcrR family transcriptional regulator
MAMDEPAEGRRERKKRETRERILAAAKRQFVERGFARTTMAEIADELDLSTQTVFNYFATKDLLLLGLADEATVALERLLDAFASTDAAGTYPLVRSTLGPDGSMLADIAAVRRDLYVEVLRVVLSERAGHGLVKRIEASVERLLEKNRTEGRVRTDLPTTLLAQMVVHTLLGAVVRWLADTESTLDRILVGTVMFLHESIKVRT